MRPMSERELADLTAYRRVIALRDSFKIAETLYLQCVGFYGRTAEHTKNAARILIERQTEHAHAANAYVRTYGAAYVF